MWDFSFLKFYVIHVEVFVIYRFMGPIFDSSNFFMNEKIVKKKNHSPISMRNEMNTNLYILGFFHNLYSLLYSIFHSIQQLTIEFLRVKNMDLNIKDFKTVYFFI